MKQSLRIIISGGGTGGHIFPAISIADAIKNLRPDADILFIGAKNRMEMNRVPAAGYPIKGLWISGFQRSLSFQNLLFPFKVILSYFKARNIVKKFKPDCVIGVGGYASGPTLRAAISLGCKTLIQEQNSFPGMTNRILAKKVNRICTAYEKMDKWFPTEKTILTGNPLRKSAVHIEGKRTEAFHFFELSADKRTLLIVGGSQGARAINQGVIANLEKYIESGIQLIWQTGESFYPEAIAKMNSLSANNVIKVHPFIQRMDFAFAAADCIVSRAGASSISEMAVIGKPVIFVPLPTAAEDHQTQNAKRLVNCNAAIMIHNNDTGEVLLNEVITLINDPVMIKSLSENIVKFALPNADQKIANEILKLIES